MSKSDQSLLRGALEALAHAWGVRKGYVAHFPKREALFVEDLTDADLEAIAKSEVPPEYDHLDAECED